MFDTIFFFLYFLKIKSSNSIGNIAIISDLNYSTLQEYPESHYISQQRFYEGITILDFDFCERISYNSFVCDNFDCIPCINLKNSQNVAELENKFKNGYVGTEKGTECLIKTDNTSVVISKLSKEQENKMFEIEKPSGFDGLNKANNDTYEPCHNCPVDQTKIIQNASPIEIRKKEESKSSETDISEIIASNCDQNNHLFETNHIQNDANPQKTYIIGIAIPLIDNIKFPVVHTPDFPNNDPKLAIKKPINVKKQKTKNEKSKRKKDLTDTYGGTTSKLFCTDRTEIIDNGRKVDSDFPNKNNKNTKNKSNVTRNNIYVKFFNYFMPKPYFTLNTNKTFEKSYYEMDTFNNEKFKEIIKAKFEKINFFIQGYTNDKKDGAASYFEFYDYNNLKNDIPRFIEDDKNFSYKDTNEKFAIKEILSFFEIIIEQLNCENIDFIEIIKSIVKKITTIQEKNKMISIQELNIEIKLLVEQKSISLTDEDWKIIKKVVINIIKKNDGIIKKIFPDIYDWLSLDYSFIYNNIESKHYDLYKYFITLFILKKLLKSQNEFLDNSIQSINDSTTNKRDTFDKQKDILVIRYNFFRVIFPLIELNIFLNYIELFFYMSMSMSTTLSMTKIKGET